MKKIYTVVLGLALMLSMTACGNMQLIDTTYNFDRAIISLPNGESVEGDVDSWIDYSDSDQIQVVIDGTTYLVHSSDVVLIASKKN